MAKEAEKRWDAEVTYMSADENPKAGQKDQADLILKSKTAVFENVLTPGANQTGFMIFAGTEETNMMPISDVKAIKLKPRIVQAVVADIRSV